MAGKWVVFFSQTQSVLKLKLTALGWHFTKLNHQLQRRRKFKRGMNFCWIGAAVFLLIAVAPQLRAVLIAPAHSAPSQSASELVQTGTRFYEMGQFEQALSAWKRSAEAYQQVKDTDGVTGNLINQAQALRSLGHYRQACKVLVGALKPNDEQAIQICETVNSDQQIFLSKITNPALNALALRSLGDVLRGIGNPNRSQAVLLQSWNLAAAEAKGEILLSLGNTARDLGHRDRDRKDEIAPEPPVSVATVNCFDQKEKSALGYYQQAIACYQQAATSSKTRLTRMQAQLNQLSLLIEVERWFRQHDQVQAAERWATIQQSRRTQTLDQIRSQLTQLPETYEGIYAQINLARSLISLDTNRSRNPRASLAPEVEQLLTQAQQRAKTLGSRKAEAYTIGNFGWFYEQTGNLQQALTATQTALGLAKSIQADDMVYQFDWQLGRILKQQGEQTQDPARLNGALLAYQEAVAALQATRKDLTAVNPDIQFSFRDTVEPVYRELVDLVLRNRGSAQPSQTHLEQAITAIDALQLAELQNFFRCDISGLILTEGSQTPKLRDLIGNLTQQKAALIYPIILGNRVAVIFQLPGQPLAYAETWVKQSHVKAVLRELRENLTSQIPKTEEIETLSQEVYQWLMKPIERSLSQNRNVDTLVFVLDGALRNIPMAALYDGREFLLQKPYGLTVAPSLGFIEAERRRKPFKLLIAGVDERQEIDGETFSALETAQPQIQQIKQLLASSQVLLNANFTKTALQQELDSGQFSAIHLVTHGKFSSDPEKTYIVAHNKELIKGRDLGDLIQVGSKGKTEKIELLVFSACETTQGDDRATLGLSGIAVTSGSRSTLGTLWDADEAATTQFVVQFYRELMRDRNVTKAEALRRAQLALLNEYQRAYIWAPYTLVGNWL